MRFKLSGEKNVPKNVPARVWIQSKSTLRQPTMK